MFALLLLIGAIGFALSTNVRAGNSIAANLLPAPAMSPTPLPQTFAFAATTALATLEGAMYRTPGRWNMCIPDSCGSSLRDWGADSLTYTLFLRWKVAHDTSIAPIMSALTASAPNYGPCILGSCGNWSDIPMWDSIAASREYEVTQNPVALLKAKNAFATVDGSNAYALGACPTIAYQRPGGGSTHLKTLETDSNYIKAALILSHWTGDSRYLAKAVAKYAAVRRYFLDPLLPLYSVYVFDDGVGCTQVPGRFFASVNGNMIYSGFTLAWKTGNRTYLNDALATAQAVTQHLNDASGAYAELQADNDVGEPLVESMYDLATELNMPFARNWLVANAAVAVPARSGGYGRFFGGPAPAGIISAWSANGGLALAIAAGAIDPAGAAAGPNIWQRASYVPDSIVGAPATITFTGQAIALIGTIGEVCCEPGHVRVFIDGRETVDTTGIWQNKSPASRSLPNSVLFNWRWPVAGTHTIVLEPGQYNAKEGASYVHLQGYELVR